MGLAQEIFEKVKIKNSFNLAYINGKFPDKPAATLRARIYDNLDVLFKRLGRGIYVAISKDQKTAVAVLNQDGRDLNQFDDNSFDAIITDHPYEDNKSNVGGSRKFIDYNCFKYDKEDFLAKARVLKPGGFLVEFFAEENANNYEYIYQCKQYAKECGFQYYTSVPWKKGSFVANTGRKAKNTEQVVIFSKGKPRMLRPDKQRGGLMSGTAFMLPTTFDYQPKNVKEKIHKAEKPVELLEAIIEAVTLPQEVVLDQFAGSGNLGLALLNKQRFGVLIEKAKDIYDKILDNLQAEFMPPPLRVLS